MIRIIFEHHPKKGQENEFIKQWQKGSNIIQKQAGARGSKLFRKLDDPRTFYAIAEWESKEDRDAAIEKIKEEYSNADEILKGHEKYLDGYLVLGVLDCIAESNPPKIKKE